MPVHEIDIMKLPEVMQAETDAMVEQVADLITFAVFEGCVKNTPVDTGRARSGWAAETGRIPEHIPPKLDKAISRNQALTGAFANVHLAKGQPYTPRFIANNVEYIGHLEDGKSQQAPAGIVGPAIATVLTKIRYGEL